MCRGSRNPAGWGYEPRSTRLPDPESAQSVEHDEEEHVFRPRRGCSVVRGSPELAAGSRKPWASYEAPTVKLSKVPIRP